jgi:hypothetical protein
MNEIAADMRRGNQERIHSRTVLDTLLHGEMKAAIESIECFALASYGITVDVARTRLGPRSRRRNTLAKYDASSTRRECLSKGERQDHGTSEDEKDATEERKWLEWSRVFAPVWRK